MFSLSLAHSQPQLVQGTQLNKKIIIGSHGYSSEIEMKLHAENMNAEVYPSVLRISM